ncbi:hypothetical protein DFH07DRAFT_775545 [Mycena maculata]|uniref:Uncharacterized protein n=1 Tax=Mycena maculata TaxID=230809 RepID=A0AAD7IRM5_9AGAR|nr:hypothetical protein DFH07DRAFT_775545 [Mycena maculata]
MPKVSSHAARNPSRMIQPTCKRQSEASRATRALATERRHQQAEELEADLEEHYKVQDELIQALAEKYGRTGTYIRKIVCNGARYGVKHAPNLRNMIAHDLSKKAREEGGASNLREFEYELTGEEYQRIKASLDDTEKKRLLDQLADHRAVVQHGLHATNKANQMDAVQTATQVGEVMRDLYKRTDVVGIGLFSPDDDSAPCIVDSFGGCQFFEDVLHISALDVVRKLEAWNVLRDKEVTNNNKLDNVRAELTENIRAGLRTPLPLCYELPAESLQRLKMEWTNYHVKIRHELGVELAGWPEGMEMRPLSKLHADDACRIWDKLRTGAIHWVALTRPQRDELAEEIEEERATGVPKKRKTRSDKDKLRGPHAKKDATNGEDAMETPDEMQMPPAPLQQLPHARPATPAVQAFTQHCTNPAHAGVAPYAATAPAASTVLFSVRIQLGAVTTDAGSQLAFDFSNIPGFDFGNVDYDPLDFMDINFGVNTNIDLSMGSNWCLNTSNRDTSWPLDNNLASAMACWLVKGSGGMAASSNAPSLDPTLNSAAEATPARGGMPADVLSTPSYVFPTVLGTTGIQAATSAAGSTAAVFSTTTNTAPRKKRKRVEDDAEKPARKSRSDKGKPCPKKDTPRQTLTHTNAGGTIHADVPARPRPRPTQHQGSGAPPA